MGPNASKDKAVAADAAPSLGTPIVFGKGAKKGKMAASLETDVSIRDPDEEKKKPKLHPTVFTWGHGGRQVYISGTFNGWRTRIPMQRSGTDFHTILTLPKGEHLYKFIVDEEWSFAPDQPTATDAVGNVTNVILVKDDEDNIVFDDLMEKLEATKVSTDGPYDQEIPNYESYKKEPQNLPPHLFRSVLDTATSHDPTVLATPSHVMLNHLYSFSQRQEGVIALGLTHRYRDKFITTVFYRPHTTSMSPPPASPLPVGNLTLSDEAQLPLITDEPATADGDARTRAQSDGSASEVQSKPPRLLSV